MFPQKLLKLGYLNIFFNFRDVDRINIKYVYFLVDLFQLFNQINRFCRYFFTAFVKEN